MFAMLAFPKAMGQTIFMEQQQHPGQKVSGAEQPGSTRTVRVRLARFPALSTAEYVIVYGPTCITVTGTLTKNTFVRGDG